MHLGNLEMRGESEGDRSGRIDNREARYLKDRTTREYRIMRSTCPLLTSSFILWSTIVFADLLLACVNYLK